MPSFLEGNYQGKYFPLFLCASEFLLYIISELSEKLLLLVSVPSKKAAGQCKLMDQVYCAIV